VAGSPWEAPGKIPALLAVYPSFRVFLHQFGSFGGYAKFIPFFEK
jgi:hypothetical protein